MGKPYLRIQIDHSDGRNKENSGAPLQKAARSWLSFLQLGYPEVHILYLNGMGEQARMMAGLVAEGPSSQGPLCRVSMASPAKLRGTGRWSPNN